MNGTGARIAAGVALALAAGPAARAETHEYVFEIRDGQRVGYEIPVAVQYPGELVFEATWDAARVLAFRVEASRGAPVHERRSGPSPQRLAIDVAPAPMSVERYVLTILALPAAGAGSGRLTVTVPDSPAVVRARDEALLPPPPPPPQPDWWMVPQRAAPELGPEIAAVYARVEAFRDRVVVPADWTTRPDPCRWQADALEYLATARDAAARGEPPALATARFLRRVADAADEVEALRTTRDPILGGPPPEDTWTLRAWRHLREQQMHVLERRLDGLLEMLRGGHVPAIAAADWPWRMVSCMTACQRYFDERVEHGGDAPNAELATAQWDTVRAAAAALRSVGELVPDPDRETPDAVHE